jgi:Predicted transcriptional regulators|nr:MAG TPA: Helix-turn-helix XRE-family like protein [Caudoviricetes sp.]
MFVFIIKNVRESKNITLYRLMKLTGLSYSYLSELENNKVFNPSLKTMYTIANALNVKIDDLFYSELDLEKLREEMYDRIDIFGLDSKEVLEVSQIIDLLINVKMKES